MTVRPAVVLSLALLFAANALSEGVRYSVRWTEDGGGKTRVLYEANISGPRATDFDVVLRDGRFEMKASFVAEGAAPVDLRVRIETRRRHGTSPKGLPLWEEDRQEHRFRVDFDQQIELLPFGSAGPRGLLRMAIVPRRAASDTPVGIDIKTNSGGDAIGVHAYRVPHWYDVRARIEENGKVIARTSARLFARENKRITLARVGELVLSAEPAPYLDAWSATLLRFSGRWNGEGVVAGRPVRYPVRGPRGEDWTFILEVQPIKE